MHEVRKLILFFMLTTVMSLGDAEETQKVPGAVRRVETMKSCDSIMVSWRRPDRNGGSKILNYKVTLSIVKENKTILQKMVLTGGNTTARFLDLESKTQYSVGIRARNSIGLGSRIMHQVTTQRSRQKTINATRISHNNATISSKSINTFICSMETIPDTVNFSFTFMSNTTLTNLTSNTMYTFDCIGQENKCAFGNGNFTTTTGPVPSRPTNITEDKKTCTSTRVSWTKPDDDGGSPILYYIVTSFNGSEHRLVPNNGINSLTLVSLKPKTSYTVHIKARNSAGLGPPAVFNFTTKDTHTGNIRTTAVVITSNSIDFILSDVNQNYECTITPQDAIEMQVTILKHGSGVFRGLQPNTKYRLKCEGLRNNCSVNITSFRTRIGAPNPPVVKVETADCSSITLSLTPPNITGGENIQEYNILWYTYTSQQPETRIIPGGSTSVTLTGLSPNTEYSVNVSSNNSEVTGHATSIVHATAKRSNINTTVVITSNSINFTLNDTNQRYTCTITPQDAIEEQDLVTISKHGTGVFRGLQPNTNYSLNCGGIMDNCSVSSTNFRTRVGAPDPPVVKVLKEDCTSISLSLTPPNITGGEMIQKYNIWYTSSGVQPKTRMVSGESFSVTLTGLSPNTAYTIYVNSSNSVITGHAARIDHATAMRDNTNQGNLTVNSINATTLHFSHSLHVQIEYSCREDGPGSQPFNVSRDGYTLRRLQPDTEYTFNCVAYHNGFDYCLEVNREAKTLPAKVNDLNVTGLAHVQDRHIHQSISWKRPPHHNSSLTYNIRYRTENGLLQKTTNMTTFNLIFPTKTKSYVVRVAAKSAAGEGEYKKIDIEYKAPSAPKVIKIVNGTVTCNRVSLQWSPPDDTGGLPIVGYSISKNGMQFKVLSSGQQTNVVLRNLLPGKLYSIKVKAKNAINFGEAQAISMTTESRSHFELQFQPYSSTKAHLIITPPGNEDGIMYSCTIAPRARVLKNTFNLSSEHNITLDNLTANTTYKVKCLMYNISGEELCYEGKANGSTFPSVPGIAPTNVIVTSTSSTHLTVEWDLPEEYKNNQDIKGYNVLVYLERGNSNKLRKKPKLNETVHGTAYTATGLNEDRVYIFRVAAFTAHGIGAYSEVKIATIPIVQNITISKISNTSALVQWNRTSIEYIVWLVLSVNDMHSFGNRSFPPFNLTSRTEIEIDNLDPFRSYSFNMYLQLMNSGNGSTVQNTFKTLGAEPTESPTNLSVIPDKKNATLHWGIPPVSGRNGIITSYTVEWTSGVQQTSPINYTTSKPNFTHPERILGTLKGLSPYTNYTWRIAAVNINGTGPFSPWSNFSTDEDVPNRVENLRVTHTTASSIMVNWRAPSIPNGVIIAYSICYWTLGNKCMQPMNVSKLKETIHDLNPGIPYQLSVTAFTSAGQGEHSIHDGIIFTEELPPNRTVSGLHVNWTNPSTVNISWTPLTVHEARGIPTYRVNITSEGITIRSELTNYSHLSVGGLDQTKLYSVSVQPLTNGGEAPGKTSNFVHFGSPTTQSSFPVWIVIIVVLLLLAILICLVILIIIVLFCKYKRQQKEADMMEEVLSMKEVVAVVDDSIVAHHNMQRKEPIPKHLFCEHVRKMHHNKDDRFKTEFGDITKEPPVTKEASETNRQRNRYINIYPYDYSRVVLSDSDGTDYVNAAFLDGYKSSKRYIASQGPTPVTTEDFWEMIWEQKTTVIVMLTRLVEGTRIKCEQYWNEEINATYEPGRNLRVTMTRNKVMAGFEVRQFRVEKTSSKSDPIEVKHFLYTAWPDHGVPQYTSSMVKFILHQYKPEVKDSATPIVVHCSAGAGRTGTFVAIDTAIDRLAEEDDINIFECVELMRARRTQMVQNVSQYIYIHDAINDYVTCGETAIVAHELGQKKSEMNKTDPNTNKTGFEQLFKLLQETSAEVCDDDKEFSRRQDIAERNRYKTRYPYSDNFIQTEDDETYVNATEIKGYYGQGTFIAAQAPMKNTIEDTWNVIRQQNCSVVVVLTNFEEQSQEMCAEFWPGEVGVPMEIGYMKISLTNTVHNEQFDEHKLSISVEEADIVNKVDVYHYKAWMKHNSPDVPSLLKLMGDVQRSHQGSSGPLMVMCDDGMSRSGVFITVMSEIDRVKVEGEMDIFHTVKAARTDRPHMVSTVGDYECCHEILQQYLESFDTYANFK